MDVNGELNLEIADLRKTTREGGGGGQYGRWHGMNFRRSLGGGVLYRGHQRRIRRGIHRGNVRRLWRLRGRRSEKIGSCPSRFYDFRSRRESERTNHFVVCVCVNSPPGICGATQAFALVILSTWSIGRRRRKM